MPSRTRKNRSLIAVVLVLVLLMTSLPITVYAAEAEHTVAPICTLNLRASASTSAAVLKTLDEGVSMTLLEDSADGWAHITGGGYTGYASTAYLTTPAGSDVIMTASVDETLNLRSGPGTSYSVNTVIPKDAVVDVIDNTDYDWAVVAYGDYSGYVSKEFITVRLTIPTGSNNTAKSIAGNTTTASGHRSASFSGLPDSGTASTDTPPKMMLDTHILTLDINGVYQLKAMDGSGAALSTGVTYSSSDTNVASVSTSGRITGLSGGTATITARDTATGMKADCSLTVTSKILPTQAPTEAPTEPPTTVAETLSLSASAATVYTGCYYQLIATSNSTVSWSSSNTSIATVSSDGIVTALAKGSVTITASTSTKSASCKLTIISGSSVSLSHSSVSVTAGKTFLARCYTDSITWTSSNTAVATVNNGYILGKKAGKSVVTVSTSSGAATILVTVKAAAPIRFAYTSPNCAVKNQTVNLIAITDTARSAVRFLVTVDSETRIVDATSYKKDGSTYVWTGSTSFSAAGTYSVAAYSKYNGKWYTCTDGSTTAFVTNSTDLKTTVCAERRASDEVIALMANFEGYISSIYDDPITGDPTVGYGRVIFCGDQFYNAMTKNEAFAYLVQTVNNDGYASRVNSLLVGNGVKFNQQQFDAFVCLVYNTGTGVLTGDTELQRAILNCADGSTGKTTYYINGSYVRIRKGPGTNYDIIKELDYNTTVTILSTANSAWYQVKLADGTIGYVSSDYISRRTTGGTLDLNYVDRQTLINKFCAYHHAAGECIWGLLYRRVDEMEMFFYNDYERNYGIYNYPISYTCATNPSYHT
jgi:uncharacterized protein YgiM (DUF1202 family)/uncharacterized protein YjdB